MNTAIRVDLTPNLGGVLSSTLLTLLVVPVAYSLMDRWLRQEGGNVGRD